MYKARILKVGTRVVLEKGVNPDWLGYIGTVVGNSDMLCASVSFPATPYGDRGCIQVVAWRYLRPLQISNYGKED